MLKCRPHNGGYTRVVFYKNGARTAKEFLVHRLVAEAFIPNPENKPTVNHINEIKTDNRVENLEWATMIEQNHHGTRLERIDYGLRNRNPNYIARTERSRKSVYQYSVNGALLGEYNSMTDAANTVKGYNSGISKCCTGKLSTYYGYVWRYADKEAIGIG